MMNISDSLKTTSSLTPLSRKRKAPSDEEEGIPSKRDRFYATYRRNQNFSLPDSIMHSITMNPSTPKGYQKVIQACKYFFAENPIVVQSAPSYDGETLKDYINEEWQAPIYLAKFTSKFWITDRLSIFPKRSYGRDIVSSIIPKIYRYDASKLSISHQDILFNDFLYLASTVEDIHFEDVIVKDENGDVLSLEKIVETAAKCQQLQVTSNSPLTCITSMTMKELVKISHFWQLKSIVLNEIPADFNIDDFYDYMKKNKQTNFKLSFNVRIPESYENRLKAINDEILQSKTFDYKPPLIYFATIDYEKYRNLQSIHDFCCRHL